MITVATFYKFFDFPNYQEVRASLLEKCLGNNIKGTLLLANEGINGTIAGFEPDINATINYLEKLISSCLTNLVEQNNNHQNNNFATNPATKLNTKFSTAEKMPFLRMKVKLKSEIVTLGIKDLDPKQTTGQHVAPKDWNALLADPDVLVVDNRNEYETQIGSFVNAIDPHTQNFREFPEFVENNFGKTEPVSKQQKIAMFCTGGIRCEKSTAYLLQQGFENVYQLDGGILNYLETIDPSNSMWHGDCFVFDERVAVDHQLNHGKYDQCHGCRRPITAADKQSKFYKPGIHCAKCYQNLTPKQLKRFSSRNKQIQLAKSRNQQHLGVDQKK